MSVTQGYGAKISYGDMPTASGSTTWTDFANIIDIKNAPKIEAKDIAASTLNSPNQFEQAEPGWASAADCEVKIQFEKTFNANVYQLFRAKKGFRITFNDQVTTQGSHWDWDGWIKGFANEIDRENLVTADITVKINSKPVFTPAS